MKLQQLLLTFILLASSSVYATSTSYWEINSSIGSTNFTFIRDGNSATGTYATKGQTMTGTVSDTAEGLRFEGWWTADDTSKSCGEGRAFSGPVVIQFSNSSDTMKGDWGYCDEGLSDMDPNKKKYRGTSISGSLIDTGTEGEELTENEEEQYSADQLCAEDKADESEMAEVDASDLRIDIPKLAFYPTKGGSAIHYWAQLEFAGTNVKGELLWKLSDTKYGEIEEE